jgi:hypothetical protein
MLRVREHQRASAGYMQSNRDLTELGADRRTAIDSGRRRFGELDDFFLPLLLVKF